MANDFVKNIPSGNVVARQPVAEALMKALRENQILIEAALFDISAELLAGAVDSVLVGTVTDANPTSGAIDHDNQFDGRYLHFTSGAAYTANNLNRYKIIATSFTNDTIAVSEDLATIGVVATDTYVVLGHTHDGDATSPDGAKIDLKHLINMAEDLSMTQALADALTDPDGNRDAATKANPLATISDLKPMVWVDDGTQVFSGEGTGLVSISSQVPVDTTAAQIYFELDPGSTNTLRLRFREPGSGTYRDVAKADTEIMSGSVWVPVNSSRQIDRQTFIDSGSGDFFGEVRMYR